MARPTTAHTSPSAASHTRLHTFPRITYQMHEKVEGAVPTAAARASPSAAVTVSQPWPSGPYVGAWAP
ncbi:hypothetical protein ACG7TL_005001 [Trametes sanguinea]